MSYPPALYVEPSGVVSATIRPADAPADLAIGDRSRVGHLATGATTAGQFGLYRFDLAAVPAPDTLPAGHYHRTITESFFILSGTVALYDGDRWYDSKPGDYFLIPPGGIHGFSNRSGAEASMLVLFTPGAPREAYFQELADIAASGRVLTDEEWNEVWARHDQYPAP
jgi:quercetin dioxygenase-like cupin family protein